MIGWILSAVGLGGIGAALVLIPGALPAAVRALTVAWGWATKNPAAALCGLFLATTVWFWWADYQHTAQRDAEIAGRTADKAAYVQAQADAVAKQLSADQVNLAGQLAHNDRLDQNHAALNQARSDSVAAYVRLHPAVGGASCHASSTGVHRDTGPAPDAPSLPDTIAVPSADLDQFGKVEMHDSEAVTFLQWLIEQGLAVPASRVPVR